MAESIEVLAKSDALPFQVSTALENESENKLPGEDVRLKYRYLDLRRPSMQRNLKLRAQMSKAPAMRWRKWASRRSKPRP